jgi:hypothetical protein
MNDLLRVNEGLSSRFADEISFPSLSPAHCLQLLADRLKQSQIALPAMQDPKAYSELLEPIAGMSTLPSWGNAREIQTLAKSTVRAVYKTNPAEANELILPTATALKCIHHMLSERRSRAKATTPLSRPLLPTFLQSLTNTQPALPITSSTSTAT